ncbi:MAG TPA: hypothetical protein VFZ21_14655 [Gemmatimonadaceae bacterium]|jgi:hypothetical protein|nr:hypothetical protein [Gemmatimonadaceae bacterium]
MRTTRVFLLCEAAAFAIAATIHSGMLVAGYEHPQARIAESILATVLLLGLVASFVQPAWTARAGAIAQTIALIGTLVGIGTIAVGVGPRTVPDVIYHIAIVVVLVAGIRAARQHRDATAVA